MTVANNYAPIRQLGNGATTQYSAAWSMIAATYALVQLENVTTGVRSTLTQGVGAGQYQIVITASGFTVTLGQPAGASNYVNVSRVTGLDQTDSYRTSKGFQGEVEENSFDKLTAMVQDAAYRAGLAITIPSGETTTTLLPSALLRASTFLGFDASGNVAVFAGISSITVSSAMVPVVQAATLALARTAMGVAGLADNNAFTGTNTAATAVTELNTTQLATLAAAQNKAVSFGAGFVNKFRNPGCTVSQRGTSGSVTGGSTAYTLDGHQISATGAAIAWAQGLQIARSHNCLQLTGQAGVTNGKWRQRIESFVAAPLAGQRVTFQACINNSALGVTLAPTLTVNYANAADNFGAVTNIAAANAVALQTVANATTAVVAYSFDVPNLGGASGAANGLEFILDFGNALNGAARVMFISDFDVRPTPNVTTSALNANPPPVEDRAFAVELANCQRYLYVMNNNSGSPARWCLGFGNVATSIVAPFTFPVPLRTNNAAVSLLSGAWNLELCSSLGSVVAMTSANVFANFASQSATNTLQLVTAGGLTAGVAYFGQLPSAGGAISFSAEL